MTCNLTNLAPIEAVNAGTNKAGSSPGFVFVDDARALALSASVFREIVYDFRELAPVAHASRTSTR
jgi:hypothetical protein